MDTNFWGTKALCEALDSQVKVSPTITCKRLEEGLSFSPGHHLCWSETWACSRLLRRILKAAPAQLAAPAVSVSAMLQIAEPGRTVLKLPPATSALFWILSCSRLRGEFLETKHAVQQLILLHAPWSSNLHWCCRYNDCISEKTQIHLVQKPRLVLQPILLQSRLAALWLVGLAIFGICWSGTLGRRVGQALKAPSNLLGL